MTPAGLEPAIPGSVGRCLIHWATGPLSTISEEACSDPLGPVEGRANTWMKWVGDGGGEDGGDDRGGWARATPARPDGDDGGGGVFCFCFWFHQRPFCF